VPVAFVDLSALGVGESAQPQQLQALDRVVQFDEVLLEVGIGQGGELLGLQGLDRSLEPVKSRRCRHLQHEFESKDPPIANAVTEVTLSDDSPKIELHMLLHTMTTLFLIRHGLTAQTGKMLYGRTPGIPLDHRGQAQAELLVERLAPVRLTAIYSSPLERCVQTVEPLGAAQRLPVIHRPGLIEMDAGEWTGKPLTRLRRTKRWGEVQNTPSTFRFPGGESFAEALERVAADVDAIARRHRRGRVAVATHGDIVRILLAHLEGAPLDRFQRTVVDTASVSVVYMDGHGGVRVLLVNDTGGLDRFGPNGPAQPWEAATRTPGSRGRGNLRG
jgi:probable phosphomutase (TIGR03848 family)